MPKIAYIIFIAIWRVVRGSRCQVYDNLVRYLDYILLTVPIYGRMGLLSNLFGGLPEHHVWPGSTKLAAKLLILAINSWKRALLRLHEMEEKRKV